MTAYDPDSGSNGEYTFRLNQGGQYFNLVQKGATAELTTRTVLDREGPISAGQVHNITSEQRRFYVSIYAEDHGRTALSGFCFFFVTLNDINDNAPVFDDIDYVTHILRSKATAGSDVIRVFAYDNDFGQNAEIQYSKISEDPVNQCGGQPCFNVDQQEGWIRMASAPTSSQVWNFHFCHFSIDMAHTIFSTIFT